MPNGKFHHELWKAGWGVEGVSAAVLLLYSPSLAAGTLIGYYIGQWIEPDWDIVGMTSSEGRLLKLPVLGWLLVAYTTIYGAAFRRKHRSVWTHGYVISTAIRFAYSFWWLYFAIPILYDWMAYLIAGVFMGLCLSDAIHITADKVLGGR